MTKEEALEYLKGSYGDGSMGFACLVSTRAIKTAIEALEKQIPIKPTIVSTSDNEFITFACTTCNHEIELEPCDHTWVSHCLWCGQAIDWSEEAEQK